MEHSNPPAVMAFRTIAVLNELHGVYLVQDPDTGKVFVKKILDVYNPKVYEYLRRYPITGTPGIIGFHEEAGRMTVVEEYISGSSLQEKIGRKDLLETDILNYMLDLCAILEKLHTGDHILIHRDVKPSNIIITAYNRAVLLDFNAAKFYSPESAEDTVLLGTRGYAAPEQYGFGASTPQTDIYALGITLQKMLETMEDPPAWLSRIARRCTQIDPARRFTDITELQKELASHIRAGGKGNIFRAAARYLPPGFRSGRIWKMLTATAGYILIGVFCFQFYGTEDVTGLRLHVEQVFVMAMMLAIVFGCFDYLHVQSLMPLCRRKSFLIRCIGIALLDFLMVSAIMFILILLEAACFPV